MIVFLRKYHLLAGGLLLLVYLVNGLITIPQLSPNSDERDHFNYATRFVKGHPEKVKPFDDASTMPVSVLNTIPRAVQQLVHPTLKKADGGASDIIAGRYITLIISLLIGVLTWRWSFEWYGRSGGLLSLFFFTFCPNLFAHSCLVTTDSYSALFTLASAYLFWKSVEKPGYLNTILFALALAMAQLAKQSLTHLLIVYLVLYIIVKTMDYKRSSWRREILKPLIVFSIILVVISAGFQFKQVGWRLTDYNFRSSFFKQTSTRLAVLNELPLPLPKAYIDGLDLTKNIDEMGPGHPESSGKVYVLGQYRQGRGFWYYYFVVLFFKTPIPVLICTFLFVYYLRKRREDLVKREFIPLFIIGYLLVYFSFFYNSQVGIRHIIMIFPLLYVLLGSLTGRLKWPNYIWAILLVYSVATFYYYFPNLLSYTNEFLLPKRNAYRYLSDSNIEYQHTIFWYNRFLKEHPDIQPAPGKPHPGKFIVNMNDYLNLDGKHNFRWLHKYKPTRQEFFSYLVFEIPFDDPGKVRN